MIIKPNRFFSEFTLTGNFQFFKKNYNLIKNVQIADSVYSYEKTNDILFDFSSSKKSGFIKLNDKHKLMINFFMDIYSNNQKFRLFKIDNIDEYDDLWLSIVYVTNYNYGIVGEFILGQENKENFVINPVGFIPNEKYFYSIFKKAQLL